MIIGKTAGGLMFVIIGVGVSPPQSRSEISLEVGTNRPFNVDASHDVVEYIC